MAYKKQEWFELKRNGVKFELVVRDQDFKKIETKRFTPQDFTQAMKDIGNRYGISKDMLIPNKDFEDEMSWLRKKSILK